MFIRQQPFHSRLLDDQGEELLGHGAFEKTIPWRRAATYGTAAVLLVLALLLFTAPGALPGLTTPHDRPMQQMTPMGS